MKRAAATVAAAGLAAVVVAGAAALQPKGKGFELLQPRIREACVEATSTNSRGECLHRACEPRDCRARFFTVDDYRYPLAKRDGGFR